MSNIVRFLLQTCIKMNHSFTKRIGFVMLFSILIISNSGFYSNVFGQTSTLTPIDSTLSLTSSTVTITDTIFQEILAKISGALTPIDSTLSLTSSTVTITDTIFQEILAKISGALT